MIRILRTGVLQVLPYAAGDPMRQRPVVFSLSKIVRLRPLLSFVAFLAFVLTTCVAAQQLPVFDHDSEIDQIARAELEKQHIPAMTVAVGLNGKVFYSKGFGLADIENQVPANSETLIRTGSIAKPLTAAAAMTLVEAGKLDLDAPVQKYCPAFPEKQWPVTTRELLTHTSGIRHYKGDDEIAGTRHYANMTDGFAIFAADPLLFEPGTKFSYSTYAYTVVGCVIEGASSEHFFDYLREHVLTPAGMSHTFVDDVYAIVPHRARGYQFKKEQTQNAGLMDSSYKIPGGGLVSTAEDIVKFGMAMMYHKIVKAQTLASMWTPTGKPQLQGGKPSTYGIGFGILTVDGEQYVAHSGGQQGTSTNMEIIPGKRFVVAVFANSENCEPFAVVRAILDLYHMPRPQTNK